MRERTATNGWRPVLWTGIAVVLLAPLIAMQFTDEVRWTGFDFAVAGGLLIGAMAIYEFVARFVDDNRWRMLMCGGLVLAVPILWAESAVGIF